MIMLCLLRHFLSVVICTFLYVVPTSLAEVIALSKENYRQYIDTADFAIVNFYADWCHFSQILMPAFEEASNAFENRTNVIFGKVDCDQKADLAREYNINKFPTIKYFRYGVLSKREYRGSRSVKALTNFVEANLDPVFITIASRQDVESQIDTSKRNVFAFLNSIQSQTMENLKQIVPSLRDDCKFYLGVGQNFYDDLKDGDSLVFRPVHGGQDSETKLSGSVLLDLEYVRNWITDRCIPLVRELTFENAEELTEEGIPFLILFRKPDDDRSLEIFTEAVSAQLREHRSFINFLHADGIKFGHPLMHLGKSQEDLPLIAIDSFTHMYLFPDMQRLSEPNGLLQFVLDLYSGKLHREYHQGPDPVQAPVQDGIKTAPFPYQQSTDPPVSVFKKLKPSQNRYTILRDEL